MKELSIISKRNDWDYGYFSRNLFKNLLFGTTVVAFLSNTSPTYAKNFDIIELLLQVLEKATAVYSQENDRNVFSAYDHYNPYIGFFDGSSVSKVSYLTVLNTASASKVNTSSDYISFLITMLSKKGKIAVNVLDKDSDSIQQATQKESNAFIQKNLVSSVDDDYGNDTALLNTLRSSEENYPIQVSGNPFASARAGSNSTVLGQGANAAGQESVAIGFKSQATQQFAIALGNQAQATKKNSIAIGYMAHAMGVSSTALGSEYNEKSQHEQENDYTTAKGDYSTALGSVSRAMKQGATAVGHRAKAEGENAISIGFYSKALADYAITLGANSDAKEKKSIALGYSAKAEQENAIVLGSHAKASVTGGVAIGADSIADVAAGVEGYSSLEKKGEEADFVWKSTQGAVSIGDISKKITRQIVGVAAGTADTDAVNVAQLKSLQTYVDKGWKLSVDGKNAQVVSIDDSIDLSAGSTNLNITKGEKDNNVKFDLAKEITLNKITAGANTLDATGLIITNGPKIVTNGIDAGGKKITGVVEGTEANDAVNFSQLQKIEKEVEQQVAASSFVKQDPKTKDITIGKDTDGTVINFQNKDNGNRTISGVMGGEISKDSIEAVNGSQLFETNDKVATYFGGGASYKGGAWNAPTFNIKTVKEGGETENKEYHDVAEALTGVSSSIANVQNKFTQQINDAVTNVKGDSLVKWNDEIKLIKIGEEKEGAEIDITNKDGGDRTILGVKSATKDNEAVNFSQLKELKEQVAANSFVKQDTQTQHITIGKDTSGDKIDIANNEDEKRTLTGIKAGALLENSNEAVIGSQLFATNNDVTTLKNNFSEVKTSVTGVQTNLSTIAKNTSQYLGSDADVLNGKAPTYTVEGKSYNDVASAFSGVSHSFTEVKQQITNVNNSITNVENQIKNVVSDSLVKQDEHTKHITIGKNTEGDKIDITNKNGDKRTFTGIKDGTLSAESKEAITGSQLFTTNQKVDNVSTNLQTAATNIAETFGGNAKYQDGKWADPTFTLKTVNGEGKEEDKTYKNVAEALTGIGTSFTNVQNKIGKDIANQINSAITTVQGESLVKKDKETNNINIGQEVEGGIINITNSKNEKRILTGIKDGAADADAVNFSQLKGIKQEIKDKVKEVQEQVTASSFVKQEDGTKHITIGKDTDGDKIDIANNKNEKRTLTSIKDGALSKDSNEAVTGSQLFTTNQNVTTVSTNLQTAATSIAKSFGGSAKYENGIWSAPTFTLKTVKDDGGSEEKIYNNVTEALSGVGTSFTNVQKQITEQINYVINKVESENLVQQEEVTNNITIGAKIEGSIINITNKNSEDRTLSGVKEATKGNEAVNKGQLDTSIKEANNEITNKFNDFTENVTHITQQVKGDALLWSETDKAFIADHGEGSAKTNSKITHLLEGGISSSSKDAITGSQLYSLGNAVSASLGGGASYEEGSWIAPTFTVNKFDIKGNATQEDYKNVADALSGLSTSLTNTQNKMTNEIAHVKDERLVKQDDKTKLIMIGGEKDGTVINIANKDKEDRRISGIKAAENANEAVNKAQLDKLDKKIESTNSFAVFYDKQSDDTVNYKSVTFGGKNKEPVALHNVANGALLQESHDAINGGQITKIFQQVVKYFGGNAAFKEGIFTGPIYKLLSISENGAVGETDHDNIVSAFEGLDTNIKNVNKRIKEVSEGISDDSLLWDKNKEAYVALHGEGETRENSKITNLKDGDITANSSDAVNGSQLYSLNEQLATYFGGGAGYDKQGNWQAPNFKIKQFGEDGASEEKSYSNISDALSGIGNSFTNIQNKITHEISKIESENLVKQDEKTKRITIGGEKDGSELSIANSASGVRSLSGVKAGLLIEESTEAINGSQLYSVINVLSRYFSGDAGYKDGKWLAPGFKVAQFTAAGVLSKKENYTNVASAFEGVNESMTKINNRIHDFEQSVFSGGLNWSETEKAFDARHKGQDSKIKHVADGEISESSKEAVNGRQLWQTNKKVKEVESHVNMIDKQVKDIASVADIAVKYDKGTDGKKTNKVTLVGMSESDPVLIDNVAEGRIESGSKEAVTGGQLHDYTNKQMKLVLSDAKKYTNERFKDIVNNTVDDVIHETKSYTDVKFEALRYEIKEVHKESKQAAAIGLAVSNLSYEDTPGSLSLSIGTGTWRNQSAFAVGAGYMSENGRIRSNISATSSGRHWGIGAGLRVKLN
ncbi:Vomp family autotransporter [Bartonella queenslandensis]|uniref:Vomp family autotransporter n=1 Tax=Bartonella queenslandensis TaxID=481138 RepID=UPI001BA605B6|nr:Vomp family autotransporter [Bartonella queenslandensis]